MSPANCLYWDGNSYQLACPDDLCHNGSETLCGLEHGYDFDVVEEDPYYDGFEDEEEAS